MWACRQTNYLQRDKFISKVKIELVKLTLADKNADRQAGRQKDRQINRQKDRQTYDFTSHKWTEKEIKMTITYWMRMNEMWKIGWIEEFYSIIFNFLLL